MLAAIFALAIPWAVGMALMLAIAPWPRRGREWASLAGQGLPAGLFLATVILRAQDALVGGFQAVSAVLSLLTVGAVAAGAAYKFRSSRGGVPAPPGGDEALAGRRRLIWSLLLALVLVRFVPIVGEVLLRPVFPWDAWATWSVMAKLWVIEGRMIPFVSPEDWSRGAAAGAHALDAWRYPATVPLFQVWMGVVGGEWSDTLAGLPWVAALMALGLAFYGEARALGTGPLPALMFVWILLSLPLLDTHAALAGYADLWLTLTIGLAAMSLARWSAGHERSHLYLMCLWLFIAASLKVEGIVWAATFLPAVAAARWRGRVLLAAAGILAVAFTIWYFAGGVSVPAGAYGRIVLTPEQIALPYLGSVTFGFHPVWGAVGANLFVLSTWGLFWYLAIPALCLGVRMAVGDRVARTLTVLVATGMVILFVLFFLTGAAEWAVKYTSINRVIMHSVAATAFLGMWLWNSLSSTLSTKLPDDGTGRTQP